VSSWVRDIAVGRVGDSIGTAAGTKFFCRWFHLRSIKVSIATTVSRTDLMTTNRTENRTRGIDSVVGLGLDGG
jgi:hypothetical protein